MKRPAEESIAMSPRGPRLSVVRILTALVLIAASFAAGTRFARQALQHSEISTGYWFAPYVDVTLPPFFDFQDPVANPNLNTVLSFVVASNTDPCTPAWGGTWPKRAPRRSWIPPAAAWPW